MSESDSLLSQEDHITNYGGAGGSHESSEDRRPLLTNMDESKVGMGLSHQTLVSDSGKASRFPQYLAAIIATLGGFISGTCLGWTSPTKDPLLDKQEYGFPISESEFAWIGSIMAVGALASAPLVGWLVDKVGRKNTILILVFPAVIGWALIVWAESVTMFCVGRFISGLAGGGYTIVVPLYTGEYAETSIRGTLGTYFQLQLNCGILFTYIVGSFLSVFWLTVLCGVIPIVYGAMMMFLPESPIYYLKLKRNEDARTALQWFRGASYDTEPEISAMQKNIEIMESDRVPLLEAFSSTPAKRGLVIGLGIMLFQQFSGVNSVIFYSSAIFKDAGSTLDPNVQSVIVGVVAVLFTYVSTLVVDRMGRKPLLLLSAFFMAICTFILGLYFFLKQKTTFDTSTIGWIPIMAVCVFLVVFSLGFGPIPWMFMSEIFPRQISGYACSLACMVNWISVFCVTKFFSQINEAIGTFGSFWIFTAISAVGTVFVHFLVPETKGKTLEEVQVMLGGST